LKSGRLDANLTLHLIAIIYHVPTLHAEAKFPYSNLLECPNFISLSAGTLDSSRLVPHLLATIQAMRMSPLVKLMSVVWSPCSDAAAAVLSSSLLGLYYRNELIEPAFNRPGFDLGSLSLWASQQSLRPWNGRGASVLPSECAS
jgi:hypothetical protein